MRLTPGAPDLIASPDGAMVAMAVPGRVSLWSPSDGREIASAELPDGDPDLGFVGEGLLCLVRTNDRTQLLALSLPSLETVAQLELEDRLQPLACVGTRALIVNEALEQPRIVTVGKLLIVEPIALREPLILATAAPDDRLLVASRGRDQQLECWDPAQRRALFRLNLPLMPKAQLAGFAARKRLLWIASTGEDGFLELYRYSDGRLQARAELGGAVLGAAGHPESPRLIVAVRPHAGEPEFCALDFAAGDRHELTAPIAPASFCVVEGASPFLVLHAGAPGAPLFVPLARALPPDAELPAPPVLTRATRTTPSVSTLGNAHARPAQPLPEPSPIRTSVKLPAAIPPRTSSRALETGRAATGESEDEIVRPPFSQAGTWRDRLCQWTKLLLSDPRRELELPELDDASPLADAVERLALDTRLTRALALLYGARLVGDARVPAAIVAGVLGGGAPATEQDWDEALGRGTLTRLRLIRARDGRVRLRSLPARFLDGAPARLPLVTGGEGELLAPDGLLLHDAGDQTLEQTGTMLADRYGCTIALVMLPPADAKARLERALLEARLHGAWPLLSGADPAAWLDTLGRRSSVIVVHGAIPPSLAALPRI